MSERQPPLDISPLTSLSTSDGPTVAEFIAAVYAPTEGWSETFGGVDGVIGAASVAQEALAQISARLASVRVSAIREQLRTESGGAIGKRHNISRQAVHQAATTNRTWKDAQW